MNILVVSQRYYPEHFQITEICETLVAEGNSVTVLTGLPNYPKGYVPKEYKHGQKRDETINGVHVIRANEIGRRHGIVWRILNYYSFRNSGIRKAKKIKDKFDIVFAYGLSPITSAEPALVYSKKHNIPCLYYVLDLWPESVRTMVSKKNPIFKYCAKLSKKIYQRCNRILVQSKSFFKYLEQTSNIKEEVISYLPQFANDSYVKQDFTPIDNGITDFVFMGNVGIAQDILGLVDAASIVKKDGKKFKVHIVGDGSALEEAKQKVKDNHLEDCVVFYGRQPYEKMPEYYKLADVCLATLQGNTLISATIPSKVQGYMAAGKPIIAALSGFAKDTIENAHCGLCVEPGNSEQLAKAMEEFIDHPENHIQDGENGRKYFLENFTKDKFMKELHSQMEITIQQYKEKKSA